MNEIEKVVIQQSEKLKQHEKQIEKLENTFEKISSLAQSVEILALEMKADRENNEETKQDVKAIKKRLGEIEKKPAKRWEAMTSQVITLIISAIVGYIIARIGG